MTTHQQAPDCFVIVGAGGHGRVILESLQGSRRRAAICFIDDMKSGMIVDGCQVLGTTSELGQILESMPGRVGVIVGVGDNRVRRDIVRRISATLGLLAIPFVVCVAPSAVVSARASLSPGTVVLPRVVVNTGAVIGSHAILNTACVVDHDCRIGDFVHIGPGVHLGGSVEVGEGTHVGIGSVVAPGVRIGKMVAVAPGTTVTSDVPGGAVVPGMSTGASERSCTGA